MTELHYRSNVTPAQSGFVPFGVLPDTSLDQDIYQLASALPRLSDDPEVASLVAASLRPLILRSFASKQLTLLDIELTSGSRLTVDVTDHFAAYIAYGLLAEGGDFNTFNRLVQPEMTIVDVGANFGLYAVEAGRLAVNGKVIAIEAVPEIHELLLRNAAANGLKQSIKTIAAAVAGKEGNRNFFVASEGSFSGLNNTSRTELSREIQVKTISLDGLNLLNDQAIDMLKIDVEGNEWEVLRGAQAVLRRSPEIVIMCEAQKKNLSADDRRAFLEAVDELRDDGFTCYAAWDSRQAGRRLERGELTDEFLVGNIFLVRDGTAAQERLLCAIAAENAADGSKNNNGQSRTQIIQKLNKLLMTETRRARHLERLSQRDRDRNEEFQDLLLAAEKSQKHALVQKNELEHKLRDTEHKLRDTEDKIRYAEQQLKYNRTLRSIARLTVDWMKRLLKGSR